uniref:Neurotransmitter-gated ion-channel ligand-binding domain-containing protein n=1 Tax=Ditylenchus dipsaci TaxID=166011 RepID=A0A915EQW6_9BILA
MLTTSLSVGQDVLVHGQSLPTQVSSPLIEGSGEELMDEEGEDTFSQTPPIHYRLEKYLMDNYNPKLIPRRNKKRPISVHFSIGLYQIIEVNEPQQYILLNSWIVEILLTLEFEALARIAEDHNGT